MAWAGDDDELGYDLDDWGPEQRQELSRELAGEGVAHRWEGAELVVGEGDADLAETLIDQIDHPDALPVEDDGDDAGAEVLSSFYVAADVLVARPDDPSAAADLARAAATASTLPAPYGIDDRVWVDVCRRAEELARRVGDDADEHEVAAAAGALRQVVWPLV